MPGRGARERWGRGNAFFPAARTLQEEQKNREGATGKCEGPRGTARGHHAHAPFLGVTKSAGIPYRPPGPLLLAAPRMKQNRPATRACVIWATASTVAGQD
eukprot:363516-Chlamydomonas_euryale.AAC.6